MENQTIEKKNKEIKWLRKEIIRLNNNYKILINYCKFMERQQKDKKE